MSGGRSVGGGRTAPDDLVEADLLGVGNTVVEVLERPTVVQIRGMDRVARLTQFVREGEEARRLSLRVMEQEHRRHGGYLSQSSNLPEVSDSRARPWTRLCCIKRDEMTGSVAGRHETARLEAFSDGVFAIAMTILALDLRVPQGAITSRNLITGHPASVAVLLRVRPQLHHDLDHVDQPPCPLGPRRTGRRLAHVRQRLVVDDRRGAVVPDGDVGKYLNTDAGSAAVATYGLFVLGTSLAWNIFMLALRPERGLLKPGVPPGLISSTRRRVALGFVIYLVATGVALRYAYLGLGIITAMWGFWAVIAYRALNRRERWSAEATSGGVDIEPEG